MAGGSRKGAGRKAIDDNDKKKANTVYLSDEQVDAIENLKLPLHNSFSKKCSYLIDKGVDAVEEEQQTDARTIKFIDLFAGLGGIRIGFEQALKKHGLKGKVVFSSDIKTAANKAYKANFNENNHCDITKIDPKDLPDFNFLLAGFPCQAFSQAGLGLGFKDTRGTLFFNVENILKEKRPDGFVLENVEGLVNHDKGKTFKVIKNNLIQLGYNIEYAVLNGKDFGLAQSRNRIYIIGLKEKTVKPLKDFNKSHKVLKDIIDYNVEAEDSDFSKKLLSHYRLEDVYGKSIKDKRGGSNNIHSWDIGLKGEINSDQRILLDKLLKQRRNKKWADIYGIKWMDGMPLTKEMIETFYEHNDLQFLLDDLVYKGYLKLEHPKQRINNRRVPDKSLEKGYNIVTGKLSFEFSKILSPYEVTPTIVATDVHKLAVPVKDGIRKLTVSEGLKLFGFPNNYQLDCVTTNEAFDLLGNTVCVPVINSISSKLISSYLS